LRIGLLILLVAAAFAFGYSHDIGVALIVVCIVLVLLPCRWDPAIQIKERQTRRPMAPPPRPEGSKPPARPQR